MNDLELRAARILSDPSWYGGVVAAVFVADADLQYQDSQNARRVLWEAIHRVKVPASRVKHTYEQAHAVEQTLDAVARVILNRQVPWFVRAALTAEAYLAANDAATAYRALSSVMTAALGSGVVPRAISAA